MLNLNYDARFDVLYVRMANYAPSYGEDQDGIVVYYSLEDDSITGMAIFDAKKRYENQNIDGNMLPIPIDFDNDIIKRLFYHPELGFKCTLNMAS